MTMAYKAMPFVAPAGAEIMGKVVASYFINLEQDSFATILAKHNLSMETINDDDWYPLQLYYDIDREIYKSPNGPTSLVAIGKATMSRMLAILNYESLEQYLETGLNSISSRSYVRNVPPEFGFIVHKIGDKNYEVTSNMPAANETVYGSLWEACRILKKEDETFTIRPLAGYPGNDICATFAVTWN